MENEEKQDLGNLSDYLGPQKLTAEIANDDKMAFECTSVSKVSFEGQKSPVLKLEFQREDKQYFLNLNRTNLDILAEHMQKFDFKKIDQFVLCGFCFGTRKVTNPNDGKLMDSLYIETIVGPVYGE